MGQLTGSDPAPDFRWLAGRSIDLIRATQAPSGAYLASPTFPIYRYCWLRDGAFIADAMSRLGEVASAEAFFAWCARIVVDRRARIETLVDDRRAGRSIPAEAWLDCRYTSDGQEVPGEWGSFQLDGYGIWLWALDGHLRRHRCTIDPYAEAVVLTARYLAAAWAEPCYDWWEERPGHRHLPTLAAVAAGLRAANGYATLPEAFRERSAVARVEIESTIARDATRLGRLARSIGDDEVDASLIAVSTPFEVLDRRDPLMVATIQAIERDLVHGHGVHRYRADRYYGGGEWPLLAGFLGWHLLRCGDRDRALGALRWIASGATEDGALPEQDDSCLLDPSGEAEWIARWGPPARPLLWSHAMFLTLATELDALDGGGRTADRMANGRPGVQPPSVGLTPTSWPPRNAGPGPLDVPDRLVIGDVVAVTGGYSDASCWGASVRMSAQPVAGVTLTLDRGPLCGHPSVDVVLGQGVGSVTDPTLTPAGGLAGWDPGITLPPRAVVVLSMHP